MTDSNRLFRILVFSALVFGVGGLLRADSPTASPSFSPSPTVTITPTPGPGSYSYIIYNSLQTPLPTPFVVPGNTGNSLQIDYLVATALAPGSELEFDFPPDVCAPDGAQPGPVTFYADPAFQPQLTYTIGGGSSSSTGYAITVTTGSNLTISAGTSLNFTYGEGSGGGFAVPGTTTQTSESFMVWANPGPQSEQAGVGLVPAPSPILVYSPTVSPTVTPTFTISPTFTITTTSTVSPTYTVSPTNTASPTATPVGTPVASFKNMHSYPNPFDLRLYSFVTIAFPPTTETVSITIFSLAGNPVCEIPASEIQASMGVAQWNGVDDYGRVVPGGLYFIRLKTPSVTVIHKMTVFH